MIRLRIRAFSGPLLLAALATLAAAEALATAGCGGSVFTVASADGGSPDAGAGVLDASAEAAAPFCSSHTGQFDFCSDFDEAPLPENWNNLNKTGGGNVAEDTGASTSPGTSLLATLPDLAAPDGGTRPTATAILTKTGLPKGGTHIETDFRIDELSFPDPNDTLAAVVTFAYTQGPDWALVFAFRASTVAPFDVWLVESYTTIGNPAPNVTAHQFPAALRTVGTWTHVKLDFDIDHATGTGPVPATLTIGGVPHAFNLSPPLGTGGGNRTLSIGAEGTAALGAAKLRYDNVTYSSH